MTKPRTAMSILAAVILALVAALVGPMPAAQAAGMGPTFRIGTDHGSDYVNFINALRAAVNDGGRTVVPGAGTSYQVNHTNPNLMPGSQNWPAGRNRHDGYVQVDIQMWGNSNFVRLQLRRADLYLIGWWDGNNVYHYMGNRSVPDEERERMVNGHYYNAKAISRTSFDENYVGMQTTANETRSYMAISRDTINSAVWYLWDANNQQNMARGVLRMTQFISEAARQRPLRDAISLVMGNNNVYRIDPSFVAQENNWGTLSGRLNWLLGFPEGHRDPHPLNGYRIGPYGTAVLIVLYTAIDYAHWILATSKGRN
ncbi:ribosome-inactivating family protein [Streptomyces sp. yr375]|uniref:ribosome-inactivating family protein n=1 Tax=Streptomyces sp. yr375 TaxID=1761906 RepID=UPI0015A63DB4|nr:ribosome-inactivating family protein [Streptomyces sp. yr375]